MKRVVLDANIYVSALIKPDGRQASLLLKGFEGAFEIVLSQKIFSEICRVLNYKRIAERLPIPEKEVKKILECLTDIASWTADEVEVTVCEDPDDNIYLACAKESRADYLVSGDRHLLKIGEFEETKIVSSKDFLEILRQKGL